MGGREERETEREGGRVQTEILVLYQSRLERKRGEGVRKMEGMEGERDRERDGGYKLKF